MEKKKLKIAFLMSQKGPDGGGRVVVRFGDELRKRGYSVRIFYRDDVVGFRHKLQRAYIRCRYGQDHEWVRHFEGPSFKYRDLAPRMFSQDELIVSMCAQTTLDVWSLPKDIGIKVLHCHGMEVENWDKMLKSWKIPIPKIVVSSDLANRIKKEVDQNVIGIVPGGVDTNEYFPCLRDEDRVGIGTCFGWTHTKDPASIIRVLQMLRERLPEVPLYSFGSGRKHRGLRNVIYKRLPTVAEARKIYSSCKVWFLASIREGFGLPILEAMACGCAVVSTDCGGPRDVIKDGVNGSLVDVGHTGEMVHKIVQVYKEEELRKHISRNAMKTTRCFPWSSSADKLEKYLICIYEDVTRRGGVIPAKQERRKIDI